MSAPVRELRQKLSAQQRIIDEQEKTILSLRSQLAAERLRSRERPPRNRTPFPALPLVPGRSSLKGPTCVTIAPKAR